MISTNAADVQKSLMKARYVVKTRLEFMIANFAADVAMNMSLATREGDEQRLNNDVGYLNLYLDRYSDYGLPVEVGYHKGAYTYSESEDFSLQPLIVEPTAMISDVFNDAESRYEVGDPIFIGAKGPAYGMLFDEIKETYDNGIYAIYSHDLQMHYNQR